MKSLTLIALFASAAAFADVNPKMPLSVDCSNQNLRISGVVIPGNQGNPLFISAQGSAAPAGRPLEVKATASLLSRTPIMGGQTLQQLVLKWAPRSGGPGPLTILSVSVVGNDAAKGVGALMTAANPRIEKFSCTLTPYGQD